MKNLTIFVISIVQFLFIGGCQKHQLPLKNDDAHVVYKKTDFVPRPDSAVSISQMRNWLRVNPYLDSLSILFQDSFSTLDPARQTKLQEDFVKAQDLICVRVGLTGGYPEYLWILKNVGNPKNASVLDSCKLTIYK